MWQRRSEAGMIKWIAKRFRMWKYKYVLRKMVRAMNKEKWDIDDIQNVLLHIGGEVEVLTPEVKARLGK